MRDDDPTVTDPDKYEVVFENERVRVLEYRDAPRDRTSPHRHPDSVMVTLAAFDRRVTHGERSTDVRLERGQAGWIAAQEHHGENTGSTDSHAIFVELKDAAPGGEAPDGPAPLGPGS